MWRNKVAPVHFTSAPHLQNIKPTGNIYKHTNFSWLVNSFDLNPFRLCEVSLGAFTVTELQLTKSAGPGFCLNS